jgi:outer membrane protein TolC
MKHLFFPLFLLGWAAALSAQDTLSVAECRARALQNNPLQVKKQHADAVLALQNQNLRSNSLPKLGLGAQASWQSDVFGLPIESPVFQIPDVPRDQYRLSLDATQRLWDGGSDRHQREKQAVEREIGLAQVDVELFSLRETVTELYFRALLLQENDAVLKASLQDLRNRLKQAEASVALGIALRSTADQLRIQILKTEQQLAANQSDHALALAVLAQWVGQPVVPKMPELSPAAPATLSMQRPEHGLFEAQQRSLQVARNALSLRAQPRVEAFAQGGLGRPNPFNFFETGFEPFLLLGLRAAWSPVDWGKRRREAQILDLQAKTVDSQRALFDLRLRTNTLKDQQDAEKWRAQRQQDQAIITLQEDIVRRAEAQVQEGVMTSTDYLSQLNLLTQARLAQRAHAVQALMAEEMARAKTSLKH